MFDSRLLHKTTFGEPLGVPVIKPTQILNQLGRTGLYTGKPQKGVGISAMPCKPGVAGSIPGFSIKPLSVSL